MSAEKLLEQAWDENADPFTKTVQVTIGRLRRKLGDPNIIRTTPGMGYRISPTGQADPLAHTKLERPHRHSRAPHPDGDNEWLKYESSTRRAADPRCHESKAAIDDGCRSRNSRQNQAWAAARRRS